MKKEKLSFKLLINILIFSSFFTLSITAFQIYIEYKRDISNVEFQVQQIEKIFLKSLSNNLWHLNDSQLNLQLEGILGLPDIVYAEIELESGSRIFLGRHDKNRKHIIHSFTIDYNSEGKKSINLGMLHVTADIENVYARIRERLLVILGSQILKTFFVSLFIVFIFHFLVTRHLVKLSNFAQNLNLEKLDDPLTLERKQKASRTDELNDVVFALNKMRERINTHIIDKHHLIAQLTTSKEVLEIKVKERTDELEKTNLNLQQEVRLREQSEMRITKINSLAEKLLVSNPMNDKLNLITKEIVKIFQADFCRIWIIKKGDLCQSGCFHAEMTEGVHVCKHRDKCLHLMSSAGRYTHTDSQMHGRVPFACYKIGGIAARKQARFLSNDVQHDPQIHNNEWAQKLNLLAFAGYRLLSQSGEPLGVIALFSKNTISSEDDHQLQSIANSTAQVIQASQAEEKKEELILELQDAIAKIKTLSGMLPICAQCKKIRDDKGYWNQIEGYIQKHSDAEFSHCICPECSDKLYGKEDWYIEMKNEESQDE